MIVVRLLGGLGNQMFQYALGRRLAIKNGVSLKMDIGTLGVELPGGTTRNYGLHAFNIKAHLASPEEIVFRPSQADDGVSQTGNRTGLKSFSERQFNFDPEILNLPDHVYLQGFWQTEKYFKPIEEVIRKDFRVKIPPSEANKRMIDIITGKNSVSLHIRRGDYVWDEKTQQIHGNCSLDYYARAVKLMGEKHRDMHLFVFSDDMGWAKNNFRSDYPLTLVDINDDSHNYEDLRLMSLCQHQIIANSSFSWWGAWLNRNPDKLVIAPRQWFAHTGFNTCDLIPDDWLKI
ncbi:MAG: alpha-1,2-fucosyltransferase [Thermodesulfobacteriota bacterium]